jgi:Holliday junction resolvase
MKEKEVCAELRKFWKARGYMVIRNQQGLGCKPGIPDYTVIKDGKVLYVEVKGEKGRVSKNQSAFISEAEGHGVPVCVVHSVGEFEEAWKRYLKD